MKKLNINGLEVTVFTFSEYNALKCQKQRKKDALVSCFFLNNKVKCKDCPYKK